MEEKKRTIVMFGDSLTDYFPMEKLKDIDEVAYVRFASVYRKFDNIDSFMEELKALKKLDAKKPKRKPVVEE